MSVETLSTTAQLCGLVFPWRRWDTLCTSGFVDDVTFAHNRPIKDNAITASSQSDSPGGSTDLKPRRVVRLTHQGQHRTGDGVWCPRLNASSVGERGRKKWPEMGIKGRAAEGKKTVSSESTWAWIST